MQSSKKISVCLKLIIVCLAFWFLYQKIFSNDSFLGVKQKFLEIIDQGSYIKLIFVFVLMIVNWSIDAIKWQFLISKLEKVSLWLAFKAVLLGITVSIFTPNRIGEFGGRVFCLEYADRIKAVLVTIFGNVTQLVSTVIFGTLSFIYFCSQHDFLVFYVSEYRIYFIAFVLSIFLSLLIYFLFNVSKLSSLFTNWKYIDRYKNYMSVFSLFSYKDISKVLFLSIFRFFIYSFQFYILIRFVNIDVNFLQSFVMSSLTFLSMSIIPTIALTEIGVRGSVALYFFGFISENSLGIMTASFALWIINIVIPAACGVFFVYQLKFFRK